MPKEKFNNNWDRIGFNRRAGVLAPLFSLYSKKSLGIGEFEDLKLLVDWCVKTGNSIIQLLSMNEVGSTFCPYDSISSFALEPMYVSLEGPGSRFQVPGKTKLSYVDYRIKEKKMKLLWDMYISQSGLDSSREFKKFCGENAYWLDDFSAFKALRLYHGLAPWYEWNEGYKNRDGYMLGQFIKEHIKEIDFHKWVQWLSYRQFKDVKEYAASKKVLLKGDLPILVSRDSADVWAHPDFFKLEYSAGAPPDMYCAKGQRWGMPTYNWDYIEADEFIYIKEKLKFAENFYDMLRIDHVVGLFRIWSIPFDEPMENQGLNGAFDPADENTWFDHGRKLISVLANNTSMLLCAEDLGVIPRVCPDTLKDMQIPGNDVQRWMKDWFSRHDFLRPDEYRELAVAMLSTHDTTNWAAWWENEAGTVDELFFMRRCDDHGIDYKSIKKRLFDLSRSRHGRLRWQDKIKSMDVLAGLLGRNADEVRDIIELYENTYMEKEKLWKQLKIKGPMREGSDPDIVRAALDITMSSRSIFCVELIFDLLNLGDILKGDKYQYRVNRPGTVSQNNWSLRVPLSLEELSGHKVNREIKKIAGSSGRALRIV